MSSETTGAAPSPPPCDCGHAFSVNPTWWHQGGCVFLAWFVQRGELGGWYGRGPDGEPFGDYETVGEG